MRGHGRVIVVLAAAVASLAGCGSDSKAKVSATQASTGKAPDPCSLLTDADVNAGFAVSDMHAPIDKVTRTPTTISSDSAWCDFAWHATNDSSSSFGLYVYPASIYDGLKAGNAGAETVPEIPGAYETADGYFIAAGGITLSLTGVASVAASGKLLQLAAGHVTG